MGGGFFSIRIPYAEPCLTYIFKNREIIWNALTILRKANCRFAAAEIDFVTFLSLLHMHGSFKFVI